MAQFFDSFPVIQYNPPGANTQAGSNGYIVRNITKSVKLNPSVIGNTTFMTEVAITQGQRSDQVAATVYNNSYQDWLLWMSNQQINPWDWYQDAYQFIDYVNTKYSDYVLAQEKVSFYTNNWYNHKSLMTVSGFEALDPTLTKFFQPLYDETSQFIRGYVRTPVDWRINTNHIISFQFVNTVSMPAFYSNNEIVNVTWDSLGNNFSGQIQFYSNTQMNIFHVSGNYTLGTGNTEVINAAAFQVYGTESNVTFTISNQDDVLSIAQFDNIFPLEDVYYDPVTLFDDENNKNEALRTINAVSNVYSTSIISSISKAFK